MVASHHSSQGTNMIYINKKRTIGSTGDLTFFSSGPEWTISGVNAYKTDSNHPGSSILHGPKIADGEFIDLYLNTGYEPSKLSTWNASVSFIGASSTYSQFNYLSTVSNYVAAYWSGGLWKDNVRLGDTFAVTGNSIYRVARFLNNGVPSIQISKLTAEGVLSQAGAITSIAASPDIHLVLFGQSGYQNSGCRLVQRGTL